MPLLISPALTTPLLKIPILVADAALTYISLTPPNPPPPPDERDNFSKPDFFTRTSAVQTKLVVLSKFAICGVIVAEAAAILAQAFPSPLSDRLLSFLAPGTAHPLSLHITPGYVLGATIALVGGAVRAWAYRTLGRFFTWQLAVKSDHKLVTEGPYAWVRHPSYTGFVMAPLGNLIMAISAGSYFTEAGWRDMSWGRAYLIASFGYIGFVGLQVLTRVNKEDEVLHEKFGEEWEAWAQKARYRLIPFVY
ncbi:ICMT-domain-containing protein [Pilatotrama ljubarskyi]|nr:ICMT-domain-containing protein [Pilatotrama ljubarskyi]